MNDSKRKGVFGADLLGPLIFTGATIIGVSVMIALLKGLPGENARGLGALARAVMLAVGPMPALFFAIGTAVLGGRVFLRGDFERLSRDFSGVLGTSAGLAILLGALSDTAGGGLGASTGGWLSTHLTFVVGGIVGLACFLAPIWLTWIRESDWAGIKSRQEDRLSMAVSHGVGGSTETGGFERGDGVSAEEAMALLPDTEKIEAAEAAAASISKPEVEEALSGGIPDWVHKNESSNPYPEDPRLVGEIPVGAQPLTDDSDAAAASPQSQTDDPSEGSSVQRWTPARGEEAIDAPDGDLADVLAGEQGLVGSSLGDELESTDEASKPAALSTPQASVAEAKPIEVLNFDAQAPRPSWETPTAKVEGSEESGATADPAEQIAESQAKAGLWKPASARQSEEVASTEAWEDPAEVEGTPEVLASAAADPADDWKAELAKPTETEALAGDTDEEEYEYVEEGEESDAEGLVAEGEDDEEYEYVEVEDGEEDDEAAAEAEEGEELAADGEDEEEYEYVEVEGDEEDDEAAAEGDEGEELEVAEGEEEETEELAADGEDEEEYEYVEVEEGEEGEEQAADGEEEDDEEYEYVEVEVDEDGNEIAAEGEDDEEYEYVEVDENGEEIAADGEDDEEYEYVEVEDGEELAAEGEEEEAEEELAAAAEEPESEEPLAAAETETADPVDPAAEAEEELEASDKGIEEPDLVEEPVAQAAEEPEAPIEEPEPQSDGVQGTSAEEGSEASDAATEALEDPNGETQMDLFADPGDSAETEPVVVIEPQAAPTIDASKEALRAANLILDESRVAVSLLQRNFGMDFKQSCAILDELQELGFIGPYIDGKQRDILMGREEWLSAVGTE